MLWRGTEGASGDWGLQSLRILCRAAAAEVMQVRARPVEYLLHLGSDTAHGLWWPRDISTACHYRHVRAVLICRSPRVASAP
jgi:hypothetical protein